VAVGLGQGPFGGFGRGGFGSPSQLINLPQVQQELKITPEQLKKVDAAILKALADVLEPDQSKRLRQISLQMRGFQAFADTKVQEELKFTAEQKDSLKTILTENGEKMSELRKEKSFESFQKMGVLMKETQEKVTALLSDAQKDQFKEMVGPQFKMDFGKGFFKKKDE